MTLRSMRAPWREELREVWLFEHCNDRELDLLTGCMTSVSIPPGSLLTIEGTTGRECFVVVEGEAVASRDTVELGRLGPGSIFGEMALIDGAPRVATVSSLTEMKLLVMSRQDFDRVLEAPVPSVSRRIMRILSGHLRKADERVTDSGAGSGADSADDEETTVGF